MLNLFWDFLGTSPNHSQRQQLSLDLLDVLTSDVVASFSTKFINKHCIYMGGDRVPTQQDLLGNVPHVSEAASSASHDFAGEAGHSAGEVFIKMMIVGTQARRPQFSRGE